MSVLHGATPASGIPLHDALELRLLDERGCLTDEVLCFIAELRPEQREAIDRHVAGCPVCTFHRAELARATALVRRGRPRQAMPSEARLLARQALLRSGQVGPRAVAEPRQVAGRGWLLRDWLLRLGMVVTAVLVLGAVLLLLAVLTGCKGKAVPEVWQAKFASGELLAKLELEATAAARSSAGLLAVGTQQGEIVLWSKDGRRQQLVDVPATAPAVTSPATKPTRPAARHRGAIRALVFSDDGRHLLSVGGRTIAWWQLAPRPKLLRHLTGPELLTAAALGPQGDQAFFGTARGHVLRWRFSEAEALAVAGFSCRMSMVPPLRANLPIDQRCPYGSYGLNPQGQSYCAHPATQLERRGQQLAVACRNGYVNTMTLPRAKLSGAKLTQMGLRYRMSGALGALRFVGEHELLFGREDGRLQLYDGRVSDQEEAIVELPRLRRPVIAAAVHGDLLAVGDKHRLTLLHRRATKPAGALRLPRPPIWIELEERSVTLLLSDGQLVRYGFDLQRGGAGAAKRGGEA